MFTFPETTHAAHPFLLVKESMYTDLRARATKSPWKEMKERAIHYVTTYDYNDPADPHPWRPGWDPDNDDAFMPHISIRRICGAGALAYILDPDNRSTYVNKVHAAIMHWDDALTVAKNNFSGWSEFVPVGASFMTSIIAYDVIYNDLSGSERTQAEQKLQMLADHCTEENHRPHRLYWSGVQLVWALFNNDTAAFETNFAKYDDRLRDLVTPEGHFVDGASYGWARMVNTDRAPAKSLPMDICSFTGMYDYYGDRRFQRMHEWLFEVAVDPMKNAPMFADANNTAESDRKNACPARLLGIHRFSGKAAQYAAWFTRNANRTFEVDCNDIFQAYVLMDTPLPAPRTPRSVIRRDGSAAFREKSTSDRSLMGVLWTSTQLAGTPGAANTTHSHFDMNSIHITAYGEMVLRNVGYTGFNSGFGTWSWDWIHNTARANNVAIIGGKNHAARVASGILEGFTGGQVEYACGDAGSAVAGGKHLRTFLMVHPGEHTRGYFCTVDEIDVDDNSSRPELNWHPDSRTYTEVNADKEYRWKINKFSDHDVFMNIFLATPPRTTEILDGGLASWGDNFTGKYLRSEYAGGDGRILTVLFPSDNAHAKAAMSRINETGVSGAAIDQGSGITDIALESDGSMLRVYGNVTFTAKAVLYRAENNGMKFYFVRKGTHFSCGSQGFVSQNPISLHMEGDSGWIVSPGTDVSFRGWALTSVKLDGSAAPIGTDSSTVTIPRGTFKIKLNGEPISADTLPVVLTGSLPQAIEATAYRHVLTAVGGSTPYSWSLSSGKLPAGLSLSQQGVLSGTPAEGIGSYTFTVTVSDGSGRTGEKQLTLTVCEDPAAYITSVSASSTQNMSGISPENVLDNDLSTRWSAEGDGEYITLRLDARRFLDSVGIAWYRGDERQSRFEIAVSTDGTTFTVIHEDTSSGTGGSIEWYDVENHVASYVRIIGHGNSSPSNWNSITEVRLRFADGTSTTGGSNPAKPHRHAPRLLLMNGHPCIEYEVPCRTNLSITLFNSEGRRIMTAQPTVRPAGRYRFTLKEGLAAGTYFVRIKTGNQTHRGKIILVR